MSEDNSDPAFFRKILELLEADRSFSVAVVLKAKGSTPLPAGARMILDNVGKRWGTVGGGLAEARVCEVASRVCDTGCPVLLDLDMFNNYPSAEAEESLPICGGFMQHLVYPNTPLNRIVIEDVLEALRTRTRGVVITTVRSSGEDCIGVSVCWHAEGASGRGLHQDLSLAVQKAIETGIPQWVPVVTASGSEDDFAFVDAIKHPRRLIICGGGHVGQALARQAALLGFDILVIDDRPDFARSELFPEGVATRCARLPDIVDELAPDADTSIAILTRGHMTDVEVLESILKTPAGYVGMIGSMRKVALVRSHLIDSDSFSEKELGRLHAPIGMDIGAVTPAEIAASIVAQLIAHQRGAGPGFLSRAEGTT